MHKCIPVISTLKREKKTIHLRKLKLTLGRINVPDPEPDVVMSKIRSLRDFPGFTRLHSDRGSSIFGLLFFRCLQRCAWHAYAASRKTIDNTHTGMIITTVSSTGPSFDLFDGSWPWKHTQKKIRMNFFTFLEKI